MKKTLLLTTSVLIAAACAASAQVRITEWMYQGANGEFIELTNMGPTAIDFTGWSFNDENRLGDGLFDMSAFGVVRSGESVILTETAVEIFRTAWNLDGSIKILTGYSKGFGRSDEINVFDQDGQLVDRLLYGDNDYVPGSIRTQNVSANIELEDLGLNDALAAVRSQAGDIFGSYASTGGDIGNPGHYYAAVPEPQTVAFALSAAVALSAIVLRRRNRA